MAKIVAGDGQSFDQFGRSVSVNGDTALIGANRNNENGESAGAAYVFTRDAAGVWSEQAMLLANDGQPDDQFGFSVSVDGDTALIGAIAEDGSHTGAVYVFTRDAAGVWSEQAKLLASDGHASGRFGYSVALNGDTVLIGARNEDGNVSLSGAAYVFTRDASGTWSEQQKLIASDGQANDLFGFSVSFNGATALIGAIGEGGSFTGAVYVFTRDAFGTWSEQAKLIASDRGSNDQFGRAVSVDADTALIGAFGDDDYGENAGAAYVFTRDTLGNWSQQAKVQPGDGQEEDEFGSSLALDGDTALIGASRSSDGDEFAGAAYVFELVRSPQEIITNIINDLEGLLPEPPISQAILDSSIGKLYDMINLIEQDEFNKATNLGKAFLNQAGAIVDVTDPAGQLNPYFLVAIDGVSGVLATLPVPVLTAPELLTDLVFLLEAVDINAIPEPGVDQDQLDASIKKITDAIKQLDRNKEKQALNHLDVFLKKAAAIVDATSPVGHTSPCFLVAIDGVNGVIEMLQGG